MSDDTLREDIEHLIAGAGGDTNPEVSPHEDLDRNTDDLSGLPENVAEDIRHAAGGAPAP
jgi:hypothetical protein